MALLLKNRGYEEVWPLLGGFDAWSDLGYPTETLGAGEGLPTEVSLIPPTVPEGRDNF